MLAERRSEPRDERVSAVVWVREGGVTTATVVCNASRHGLCIEHLRDRNPGQVFEVQVIDHDLNLAFRCEAVVQWSACGPASRTGVRLLGCDPAWQRWAAARWGDA
jgi:PilZ domain-containing protein